MQRLFRFLFVGSINTAVDVGLYTLLRHQHVAIIVANLVSTSAGLCIGFILHSRITFRSQLSQHRAVYFAAITVFGLWVLQPLVIMLVSHFVTSIIVPKLAATGLTLVWNYWWYSRRVYQQST